MSASQLVDLLGTPHAMYVVVDSSASGSLYSSVVSLVASLAEVRVASVGTCVDIIPRAAPEDASLSFTLDSGASHCFFRDRTTLTPLSTPVSVALAGPTSGPVTARYTTTLPFPTVPSGSLTGFHVPSFSRNLVGVRPLLASCLRPPTCLTVVAAFACATLRSLRPATEPFETLHLDVWGPASRSGPERESFFLVVVDDYSRYTIVFPLAKKSNMTCTLIRWLLTTADTGCRRVSCLHSDRGGSWTLPESPQQNGFAEPRTSMTHACTPSVALRGSVRRSPAEPLATCLSARGFTDLSLDRDSSNNTFYHPPLHRFFDSRDVRFDESVPHYVRYPWRGLSVPPPPLFLTLAPPLAPPVQPPPPVTEFASTRCLDYATSLVAAPPSIPLAVGGEFALGCDALEDKQFEMEFLAAASPHLCAMLLAPEGDPDALDIPTPRTYAEAVPPTGANVVDGMWIFRVKRPPGSPPVFKARYVARGFSQREGVDFFQIFAPTPKMTTLRGSLHEEAWLRRSSSFTGTFPPGTQWRLRRPVYGLRRAPREWHDTLRSNLSDLGFQPSSADPSLFVRRGSIPLFVLLVYVDDLVFATADRVALADVKLELLKRHTCTELGELRRYLGLQITRDRASCTITLSQSHMVHQVLQRFELQHSTVQRTPLAVNHRLTRPFFDKPFEPNGPYAELVGCLMYLMTCTRPDLAFPLSILARFVAPVRHRPVHWTAAVRVAKYLATTSGVGLVLGGRQDAVLTGHCDSSYADDAETHRST
ncbi:unnamed protein product [Closterium sp. NIES-53]